MANLKNITDLPVAESAEGLNLIVNDSGAAKQIAASAVGAQADWSVTDTASPAYILNKPEVVQVDWNQNDETASDYVKNRPFYETDDGEVVKLDSKYLPDDIGYSPIVVHVSYETDIYSAVYEDDYTFEEIYNAALSGRLICIEKFTNVSGDDPVYLISTCPDIYVRENSSGSIKYVWAIGRSCGYCWSADEFYSTDDC